MRVCDVKLGDKLVIEWETTHMFGHMGHYSVPVRWYEWVMVRVLPDCPAVSLVEFAEYPQKWFEQDKIVNYKQHWVPKVEII